MEMNARLVIVGAGIVGASAAYHLARFGWDDVILIDRGDPVENLGSTSHAPGGVVALSHNKLLTQMAVYSSRLYAALTPYSPARQMVNRVGTLEVAVTPERMTDLVRLHGESISFGTHSDLLSPAEAAEILPHLDAKRMVGALLVREGEVVAASHVSGALQRDSGVKVLGHTTVVDIDVEGGRVRGVVTDHPEIGDIRCEEVLICTNIWAPLLGDRLSMPVPLTAYEHQYLISGPLPELSGFDPKLAEDEIVYPSVRELDGYLYFRQHWNSLGTGSYRHLPRAVAADRLDRSAIHPFTPEDFVGEPWDRARQLFPMLATTDFAGYPHRINGIFAFPVDGMPIVGPGQIPGAWVAAGSWLTHAGGVGKTIAEWMSTGDTEWDVRQVDVSRFHGFQTTPSYVAKVGDKNYAEIYDIIHPREPISDPREVRLSPFDARHRQLGAVFTTFAGLELPNWFEANAPLVAECRSMIPARTGWAAQHWSPIQGAEHLATRRQAGLFDLTGLSILEVAGPDALALVDRICANRMAVAPGRVIYTTWLTKGGGVRRDLTVARLAADRFWLFVGEGTRPRDFEWVRRAAYGYGVAVIDLSDAYTALGLWGPAARRVLAKVTATDLTNDAFPYFTARWIDVGFTRALALRISYAGELGWELHFSNDFALPVWDLLMGAGAAEGLVPAGLGAFDSLRLEKGYRLWGTDVYTEYDPYQAGLGWTVKIEKGEFIGAEAARHRRGVAPTKILSCLVLEEREAVALGYEPIMDGDTCVGHVTSGNFGYSIGKFIVYGYLPSEYARLGRRLEIIYLGERYAATVAADPQFDPKMERMKA
ncbi:MAG: GcvT family protein [Actinomycetota bacterium]